MDQVIEDKAAEATPHRGYATIPGAHMDLAQCERIYQAAIAGRTVSEFDVDKCSARAWKLDAGQVCRFELPSGPQVGDLNLFNLHNFKEHFYSGKTRQIHRAHLTTGDRLWSNMPYLRPMATIVADSLQHYTPDKDGCGVHDVLGTRCDPYTAAMIAGDAPADHEHSCHQYLTGAIAHYGLSECHVHDVFNMFMCSGVDARTHEYLIKATPARKGDYIAIQADIDLLVALAACPCGDVSTPAGHRPVPCATFPLVILSLSVPTPH